MNKLQASRIEDPALSECNLNSFHYLAMSLKPELLAGGFWHKKQLLHLIISFTTSAQANLTGFKCFFSPLDDTMQQPCWSCFCFPSPHGFKNTRSNTVPAALMFMSCTGKAAAAGKGHTESYILVQRNGNLQLPTILKSSLQVWMKRKKQLHFVLPGFWKVMCDVTKHDVSSRWVTTKRRWALVES